MGRALESDRAPKYQRAGGASSMQIRDLTAYDEIFGIDLGQQPAGLLEAAS